jgi:hypothetical protein
MRKRGISGWKRGEHLFVSSPLSWRALDFRDNPGRQMQVFHEEGSVRLEHPRLRFVSRLRGNLNDHRSAFQNTRHLMG